MNNRAWMYDMYLPNLDGIKPEYYQGVDEFVEFAASQEHYMDGDKIKCPCKRCKNCQFKVASQVKDDLYHNGFMSDYYRWTAQGESIGASNEEELCESNPRELNPEQRMVFDLAGPNFVPPPWFNEANSGGARDDYQGNLGTEPSETISDVNDMEEDAGPTDIDRMSQRFWDVLKAAEEPVWPGCSTHTQLSFTARLMSLKCEYNVPQSVFNGFVQLYDEILPPGHKIPVNYYQAEKLVSNLGLPMERIDMCPNGCMLYWKDDVSKESCKFCGHSRFTSNENKSTPCKELFYLPLTPRLQRLYASEATAGHMTWHANHVPEEGMMSHPSDGDAWKRLNTMHPGFAYEPRNIRFGLSTDGFAPFTKSGQNYSCWPVIVTPYNLPPNMCMKTEYMFLTLVVPGPRNPKKLIDVCLQPLIDELMQLWESGVTTYDVSRKENFIMRAAFLWTITDFPAYAMLSGWSTAGELACPICMENSDAFRLHYGRKACWFDCHRRFLEANHPWRKNRNQFRKNVVRTSPPPPMLSGNEIWERVRHFPTAIEDPLNNPPGYGDSHKWTKQSIFWRLPYWKDLLIRHNIDVMHTEKNVFDNIFNIVMDVPGKTNDNLNARKDIRLLCRLPELQVNDDHKGAKPKAIYTLTRDEKKHVCQWLKFVKFPDGYASNLGRCVQKDNCSLAGMKSHDCHVFMERLIPIAFKELLPLSVWSPLTELSIFFQSICSSTLSTDHMRHLRSTVPVIFCKLERIFPPSFFDSMEHLLVHLPYEAEIGGPVQYRWMYPVERYLYQLKRKILQKNHVEGSICMAYSRQESSNFSVHYFPSHVPSKLRRSTRNDAFEGDESALSIFNYPGQSGGKAKTRWMTVDKEWNAAHTYVLLNYSEVQSYISIFESERGMADEDMVEKEFVGWFKKYALDESNGVHTNELLWSCACGPSVKAKSWTTYKVNGYKFQTVGNSVGKSTMNNGVCVTGSNQKNVETNFYGLLEEIIELEYPRSHNNENKIVLFKCKWFDPSERGTRVHREYRFVEVNHKRQYQKYEPFILAQQAVQVFYTEYPEARSNQADWRYVCKTTPRGRIAERWTSTTPTTAYQSDEIITPDLYVQLMADNVPTSLRDPSNAVNDVVEELVEPDDSDEEEALFNANDGVEYETEPSGDEDVESDDSQDEE